MKLPYRTSRTRTLALPSRSWAARIAYGMLLALSFTLLVLTRTGNPLVDTLRMSLTDALVPVMEVASAPLDAASRFNAWMDDFVGVYHQNIVLNQENATLLQWQQIARQLEAENQALRSLLNTVPHGKWSYVTSRIVGDAGGPYVRAALINSGTEDGIAKNQVLINDLGVVGRVIEAGNSSARVLLLTDINSRIPVILENSRAHAMAAGDNNSQLQLLHLPENAAPVAGERVITSGDGGIIPPGLPVGIIVKTADGFAIQPMVDWARLEYVSAVQFSF